MFSYMIQIEVPELYMTMDVQPNAWTYGDTKPYIISEIIADFLI